MAKDFQIRSTARLVFHPRPSGTSADCYSAFFAGFARDRSELLDFRAALASLAGRLRSAVWFLSGMEDLRRELEDLVNAQPFVPFVVTSNDGFAIAVSSSKRALVGLRMLVVTDESGRLYHFPFTGIAHISEAKAA